MMSDIEGDFETRSGPSFQRNKYNGQTNNITKAFGNIDLNPGCQGCQ